MTEMYSIRWLVQHGAPNFTQCWQKLFNNTKHLPTASTLKTRAVGSTYRADSIGLYADKALSSETLATHTTAAVAPITPLKL